MSLACIHVFSWEMAGTTICGPVALKWLRYTLPLKFDHAVSHHRRGWYGTARCLKVLPCCMNRCTVPQYTVPRYSSLPCTVLHYYTVRKSPREGKECPGEVEPAFGFSPIRHNRMGKEITHGYTIYLGNTCVESQADVAGRTRFCVHVCR